MLTVIVSSSVVLDMALVKVIQGSFHQGHKQFGETAGKQCTCCSLFSVVFSNVKNPGSWGHFWLHYVLNPLTADDKYIGHSTGTACRRRSAFHRQNHEKCPQMFWKRIKFATKWYTKLCILVDPILRNCVTKSNFRYFLKKSPKKGSGT